LIPCGFVDEDIAVGGDDSRCSFEHFHHCQELASECLDHFCPVYRHCIGAISAPGALRASASLRASGLRSPKEFQDARKRNSLNS
jgi:hypothetical protein